MDLKPNHLAHVRYTKTTNLGGRVGEVTERVILPTYIPGDSIKAFDVSEYSEKDALAFQTLAEDYAEYVQNKMATIFGFEDWIDHTLGVKSFSPLNEMIQKNGLKYRTFKIDSLEVVKSE